MHTAHATPHAAALPPATMPTAGPADAADAADAAAPGIGWAELAPQRAFLVQFARRRLLDPALAEDLVHDVFEAVITGRAQFGGRSALRSWLVAVLKHKIVDLVRQRSGHDSLDVDGDGDDGPVLALTCPQPRPDEVAEQRQRLRQTLARMSTLPPTLRRTLELRALHDASSEDICRELQISGQNLFVRLHRARKALAC